MKKLLALLLSIALLLGALGASAESAGKEIIGTISINGAFSLQGALPEGYRLVPYLVQRDQVIARILPDDPVRPSMTLSVAFDETYSDVERMNDLSDEELAILEATFTVADPTIEISYNETAYGTRLLIASQLDAEVDYVDIFSIYQGYFVEFVMIAGEAAEDRNLSPDQLQMCIDFLSELDFVPVDMEAGPVDVAGKSFTAVLEEYEPDDNTLHMILKEPAALDDAVVTALEVGSILNLGEEPVTVETLETDEYGDIVINDEIRLSKDGKGIWRGYFYDAIYLDSIQNFSAPVAENAVFLDGIDPETGDWLEEDIRYTFQEFLEILSLGDDSMDPGFAADNVEVTFDEAGKLTTIRRFYVPWQ